MSPLVQVGVNLSLVAAGWSARWTWEMARDRRAWHQHQEVERESARILPGLRDRARTIWVSTAPRGPEAIAKALYTYPVYQARHRAPLEDSDTYLMRTLKPGWRQPQIPVREVFRT